MSFICTMFNLLDIVVKFKPETEFYLLCNLGVTKYQRTVLQMFRICINQTGDTDSSKICTNIMTLPTASPNIKQRFV